MTVFEDDLESSSDEYKPSIEEKAQLYVQHVFKSIIRNKSVISFPKIYILHYILSCVISASKISVNTQIRTISNQILRPNLKGRDVIRERKLLLTGGLQGGRLSRKKGTCTKTWQDRFPEYSLKIMHMFDLFFLAIDMRVQDAIVHLILNLTKHVTRVLVQSAQMSGNSPVHHQSYMSTFCYYSLVTKIWLSGELSLITISLPM